MSEYGTLIIVHNGSVHIFVYYMFLSRPTNRNSVWIILWKSHPKLHEHSKSKLWHSDPYRSCTSVEVERGSVWVWARGTRKKKKGKIRKFNYINHNEWDWIIKHCPSTYVCLCITKHSTSGVADVKLHFHSTRAATVLIPILILISCQWINDINISSWISIINARQGSATQSHRIHRPLHQQLA